MEMEEYLYTPQLSISFWIDEILEEIEFDKEVLYTDIQHTFDTLDDIFDNQMEEWNLTHEHKKLYNKMLCEIYECEGCIVDALSEIRALRAAL